MDADADGFVIIGLDADPPARSPTLETSHATLESSRTTLGSSRAILRGDVEIVRVRASVTAATPQSPPKPAAPPPSNAQPQPEIPATQPIVPRAEPPRWGLRACLRRVAVALRAAPRAVRVFAAYCANLMRRVLRLAR